jgi:hypothetical protein
MSTSEVSAARGAPSEPSERAPFPAQSPAPTPDGGAEARAPLKREGDALLDGSGSRQGVDPDPSRDASPHE